ncbi:hypothetical protein IAQ61_001953 [Plenodomus lingam]|uniref:uncharacterized protein n=1 Tax=Leptosphaeria maculans TaxID=5022 RepID=UPI003320B269|nr:hypothetical protein IAQ61_001953 [Plenodomus lingam]
MRFPHTLPTLLFACTSLASARISPYSSSSPSNSNFALQRRQAPNATWPHQSFYTEPDFLPPILEITRHGPSSPNPLFFAVNCAACPQEAATIFSPDGELIWQSDPYTQYPATNFGPQRLNGKPVLVYNMAVDAPIVASGALTYSVVLILDDSYNLLHNISVSDPTFVFSEGSKTTSLIDAHEAYITPSNTLLVPGYNITPWDLSPVGGPKDGWLLDSVVYEVTIPDGEILWSWKSTDHIGIKDAEVPLDALYGWGNTSLNAWDYFHVNSIQVWGEGDEEGILISARNTYDVLFINKKTGNIEWRLRGKGEGGDIPLTPEGHFSYQHDARLWNHNGDLLLSIFDNSNTLPPPWRPSEGHLYTLNPANKSATLKTTYMDHNTTIAAQFGGAMHINFEDGYVILGYGSQPITEEYNLNGTMLASWRFGAPAPDFGIPGIANYRTYKSEWKGYPTSLPAVKACKSATGTDVYVSWNGATEVQAWTVFAGHDEAGLLESVSAPKTGFETKIRVDGGVGMVRVKAVGRADDERFVAQSSEAVVVQEC